MTLITVTHPKYGKELRYCLASYRRFASEPFEWVLLTEAENVAKVQEIAGDLATVQAMTSEAEAIPRGYFRQQAAKLFCYLATDDPDLVITDDDTEAVAPWDRATFFDGEKARIWFKRHSLAFWAQGNRLVFPGAPDRDYQLLLPFAIRRETLQSLAESPFASRCMDAWKRAALVSEFMVMGEYALRHDQERAVLLDASKDQHWTLGINPQFRDWQGFRGAFRHKIGRTLTRARQKCASTLI